MSLKRVAASMSYRLLALSFVHFDGIQQPWHELPDGEAHVARNWGGPPANRKQRTQALSPMGFEELNSANNRVNELDVGLLPSAFR